jgi:DNA polymerase elongation subunit (family B)
MLMLLGIQPNHLLGYRRTFIQLVFRNVTDCLAVRRELLPIATRNREKVDAVDAYAEVIGADRPMDLDYEDVDDSTGFVTKASNMTSGADPSEFILDIREYDVPYYLRVAIDKGSCRSDSRIDVKEAQEAMSQISESVSGTLLHQTPARPHLPVFASASNVPTQSSWPMISRRQRIH